MDVWIKAWLGRQTDKLFLNAYAVNHGGYTRSKCMAGRDATHNDVKWWSGFIWRNQSSFKWRNQSTKSSVETETAVIQNLQEKNQTANNKRENKRAKWACVELGKGEKENTAEKERTQDWQRKHNQTWKTKAKVHELRGEKRSMSAWRGRQRWGRGCGVCVWRGCNSLAEKEGAGKGFSVSFTRCMTKSVSWVNTALFDLLQP